MRFLEDLEIGQRNEFGSFTFTAEAIKAFARQFDPQPFHLDEEVGRQSLFGGLSASGWHVASVAMGLRVRQVERLAAEEAARGEQVAVWGPSPGFRDLRWMKPVLAGDTITYASEITEVRATVTRPGWGVMQARNTSENQHGQLVMSFTATVFVPQRNTKG
jgi:acyl dehydratase